MTRIVFVDGTERIDKLLVMKTRSRPVQGAAVGSDMNPDEYDDILRVDTIVSGDPTAMINMAIDELDR